MTLQTKWEHFPHSSDIGIRGIGSTLEAAFEQAALAMTAVITDPKKVSPLKSLKIEIHSPNLDILFLDWINEVLFQSAIHKMLFSHFDVSLQGTHLSAILSGEEIARDKHSPAVEIKGATMTELKVEKDPTGFWKAQCVLDV